MHEITFIPHPFAKTPYTESEREERPCNTSGTSLLRSCF